MGNPVQVVLGKTTVSIGQGKKKRNEPIRFDKVLPSATSSNLRPAPVCPNFSLNNQYSFHNLEEADKRELKGQKNKHTAQAHMATTV
jgi:hypothetical protein